MIRAWRICAAQYASDPISGIGAYLFGGRWNSPGVHMVYAATSQALSMLEIRVHTEVATAPRNHVVLPLDVPDRLVATLDAATLPQDWRRFPAPSALAAYGDAWVRSRESLGLLVPSAVVPEELNLLLNPKHPDLSQVVVGDPTPVQYDPRLFTVLAPPPDEAS